MISYRSIAQDPVLQLTLVNVGSNCIELRGTAIGNFTGAWNQWAGSAFVLRIPKSVFPMGKVSGFEAGGFTLPGVPDPEITSETNTGFVGITPVDLLSGTTDITTIDPVDVGGMDDGYLYFQIQDAVNGPNANLLNATTVTLFSFCLPTTITYTCLECVELLTNDMNAFFDATGISTTPFIGNSNKAGGLSVHSIGDSNTNLPIELLTFEPRVQRCDLSLYWETATERNLGYFQIEASKDGRTFATAAQQKPASPNSSSLRTYRYTVPTDLHNQYFRLKAVDLDGSFEYSPIVFAKTPCKDKRYEINLYPNPNYTSELMVEINSPEAVADAKLLVMDVFGKQVVLQKVDIQVGVNKLPINTEQLPSGTYFVKIMGIDRLQEPLKFVRSNF
ncbi:MAG TPA: T9SS type A sorting domain-containing protein [Saprospiraceae bacterium]|nr:T9SS type A sorting domain-containing protein [Saprospiraceae bacterium]HMP12831.1 T9SS type A sorting domain-containing protein [Saprospiraceae bacterium]